MSLQQVFDTMLTRMRAQGEPAINADGNCKYQMSDGRSCVVGCVMPKEFMQGNMESMNGEQFHALPNKFKAYMTGVVAGGAEDAGEFYRECQEAHDQAALPDGIPATGSVWLAHFESNMRRVAKLFDLTYTPATS